MAQKMTPTFIPFSRMESSEFVVDDDAGIASDQLSN